MPRFSQETIERVAAGNDIVEVIRTYIPLKQAGSAFKALCPFHQEKTPSFTVNPQRQTFHCFGCGAHGSVFRFLMDYEHLSFVDSVRRLAERAGIPVTEDIPDAKEDERYLLRKRLLSLHAQAADWFHENLQKSSEAQIARDYLKQRGISQDTVTRWKFGYAPDSWEALTQWASAQKFSKKELIQSGLVGQKTEGSARVYDRFRGRLMFPICDDLGQVVAFSGRVLNPETPGGKYVNSPETSLFSKGSLLFGLDRSKRGIIERKEAVVCEGQLDMIMAFESGVNNVIAPQGTAFTEKQAHLLRRYAESVILCYDADIAGEHAAERTFEALFNAGLIVRVAEIPAGEDPDSLIRKQGVDAFLERLDRARDFFDYLIDQRSQTYDLNSHQGRLRFATTLVQPVALVGDAFLRDSIISKVGTRLQLSGDHFREMVQKAIRTAAKRQNATVYTPAQKEANTPDTKLLSEPGIAIAQIIVTALQDPEILHFLREQEWDHVLSQLADGHLLEVVLRGDFDPNQPASVNAFLETLPTQENTVLSKLLTRKDIPVNHAAAKDCWTALHKKILEDRSDRLSAQLRKSDIDLQEVLKINQEILDIQKELDEIARLS